MHKDIFKFRRTSLFAMLALSILAPIGTLLLSDSGLGVHIDGSTLDASMGPVENLRYRLLIRQTTAGDHSAMKKLADFDCHGGAGCYDHGEVLVDIMRTMGDSSFSKAASGLDLKSKQRLRSLMLSGIEYGRRENNGIDMQKDFALTAAVLGV